MFEEMLLSRIVKVHILHSIPGRLRVHIPFAKGIPREWHLDTACLTSIQRIRGIRHVEFCYITANAVILYDPAVTSAELILAVFNDIMKIAFAHWRELKAFKADQKEDAAAFLEGLVQMHLHLEDPKQSREVPLVQKEIRTADEAESGSQLTGQNPGQGPLPSLLEERSK